MKQNGPEAHLQGAIEGRKYVKRHIPESLTLSTRWGGLWLSS